MFLTAVLLILPSVFALPTATLKKLTETAEAPLVTIPQPKAAPLVSEAKAVVADLKESASKTPTASSGVVEQDPDDDRLRRSPNHFVFQVIDLDRSFGFHEDGSQVPFESRDLFTPPKITSRQERRRIIDAQLNENNLETDPHAFFVLLEVPFFDEFDHAKAVLALERRRKNYGLSPHFLKSLRPFFPFFSKY